MNRYAIGAAFGAVALVGAGIVTAIETGQRALYPPEYGADYLTSQGHLVLNGGERDYFNTCGRGVFARSYETVHDNKVGEATVCFNPLFGRYQPLLF